MVSTGASIFWKNASFHPGYGTGQIDGPNKTMIIFSGIYFHSAMKVENNK